MNKQKLKERYGNEKILVVPFEEVTHIKDGFTSIEHDANIWSSFDSIGKFVYRYDAEGEPSMQQIIPYILIINKEQNKLFATKRINGDSRLIGKLSIACGGHIDSSDQGKEILFKAAVRELYEEVNAEYCSPLKIIGTVRDLNSNTNDHLGIVIMAFAGDEVEVKEKDTLEGSWLTLNDLIDNYENLEGWSKYIVDYFVSNKNFL